MLIFFGLGLGLSVTPCVFPMIQSSPASSSAKAKHHHPARLRALIGLCHGNGTDLHRRRCDRRCREICRQRSEPVDPEQLCRRVRAAALSMFGFYDLQMPAALQSRLSRSATASAAARWLASR